MSRHIEKVTMEKWPALNDVRDMYTEAVEKEAKRQRYFWQCPVAEEAYNTALQVMAVAQLSLVPRSFHGRYDSFNAAVTPESVGGHTNLTLAIVARAFRYIRGANFTTTEEGYTFQEVAEAVQRHDQAEVKIGDIPDDGNRDEEAKQTREEAYLHEFARLSPRRYLGFEYGVDHILHEMSRRTSRTGRLLYVADKVAAVIIALAHDKAGLKLVTSPTKSQSKRDREEMALCEYSYHGCYYASEMWTVDFFKVRDLAKYDDYGYCTAILIMCTLLVNSRWYGWH